MVKNLHKFFSRNNIKYIIVCIVIVIVTILSFKFLIIDHGTVDHSAIAQWQGPENLNIIWNNTRYITFAGEHDYSNVGKVLATSQDREYIIKAIRKDKTHSFIFVKYGITRR